MTVDQRSAEALELLASVATIDTEGTPLLDLHATVTRILRDKAASIVLGEHDPADVAMLIVSQPVVWSGIVRLQRIAARHSARRWREDSDTVVCAAGCGSWPCEEAEILGLAPDPEVASSEHSGATQ